MINKKITRKITQGMYVLTTNNGGCVVDAVSQISSGDNPLIAVSVMKNNYTNELLKNNTKFVLKYHVASIYIQQNQLATNVLQSTNLYVFCIYFFKFEVQIINPNC